MRLPRAALALSTLSLLASVSLVPAYAAPSAPAAPVPAIPAASAPGVSLPAPEGLGDTYIVKLRPGADPRGARTTATRSGVKVASALQAVYPGMIVKATAQQAAALARSSQVERVERDAPVKVDGLQTGAPWSLDRIDQRGLPLNRRYTSPASGTNVKAYIIDTGIRANHTQFGGRVTKGAYTVSDGRGSADCHGHGTHVAGTVGSRTYGVAKNVTLVPVRVLDCKGSGMVSAIIRGIEWVIADHAAGKPAVANISIGAGVNAGLNDAVKALVADGVTVAVSAGNDARDACTKSPASAPTAITVAAVNNADRQTSYSNRGRCVDLYAPGDGIASTWHTSTTATATMNGTSMASPHVAGTAAMILQMNASWSPAQVGAELVRRSTPSAIRNATPGTPNRLLRVTPVAAR